MNAKNSGTAKNYHTGIAFYFADWQMKQDVNDPPMIVPNLSIELGGLGFRLYRGDGKPLLEKFLLLNQLEMAFCVDADIHPTSSIEFGGLLVLDDFGIELGGGDSDGGNGMAKGLLLEEMMERMLSNQSLTLLFRSTTAMTWIFQSVVEQSSGSQSTSNSVQSMLLKLE